MGVRYGVSEKTARLFILKVREAKSSSGTNDMDEGFMLMSSFYVVARKVKLVEATTVRKRRLLQQSS